jgi:hypothetical protein
VALIVQVPALSSFTLSPDTVQTLVVDDAKVTDRPEDAVALTVIGEALTGSLEIGAKLMVWLNFVTKKLWETDAAAS